MAEIGAALRGGGRLVVIESRFDPHRQTRDTVLSLARPTALELERHDDTLLTSVIQLRKAAGAIVPD